MLLPVRITFVSSQEIECRVSRLGEREVNVKK